MKSIIFALLVLSLLSQVSATEVKENNVKETVIVSAPFILDMSTENSFISIRRDLKLLKEHYDYPIDDVIYFDTKYIDNLFDVLYEAKRILNPEVKESSRTTYKRINTNGSIVLSQKED